MSTIYGSSSTLSSTDYSFRVTAKNNSSCIPADFKLDDVDSIIVIELVCGMTMKADVPTLHDALYSPPESQQDARRGYMHALIQLIFQAVDTFNLEIQKAMAAQTSDVSMNTSHFPVEKYLETVVGDECDENIEVGADGTFGANPRATRVLFRDVSDNQRIAGYRIFITTKKPKTDKPVPSIADIVHKLILQNDEDYRRFESGSGGGGGASKDRAAMTYTGRFSSKSYLSTLPADQHWRAITSLELFAHAVDNVTGRRVYTAERTLARVVNSTSAWVANPINPNFSLSPQFIFAKPLKACAEQMDIARYLSSDNGRQLTFPKTDRVVKLGQMSYNVLRRMFLPPIQMRCIDADTIDRSVSRDAGGTMLQMRDGYNAISDHIASSIEEYAADDDDDEDDVDALVASGGGGGDGVVSVVVGGTDSTSIRNMLRSLDVESADASAIDLSAMRRHTHVVSSAIDKTTLGADDHPERSSFHKAVMSGREVEAKTLAALDGKSREHARNAYKQMRSRNLAFMKAMCMDSASDVSATWLVVNRFIESLRSLNYNRAPAEKPVDWLGTDQPYSLPDLSTFANRVIYFMVKCDTLLFVQSTHALALLMRYGFMDAYAHPRIKRLRISFAILGTYSQSKTWTAMLIKNNMYLPGTIGNVNSNSAAANDVDEDRNDCIDIIDEGSPEEFAKPEHGGVPEKEGRRKTRMTQNESTRRVYCEDESGRRRARLVAMQIGQSEALLSNMTKDQMTDAICSRFTMPSIVGTKRKDRSTAEMCGSETSLSKANQEYLNDFVLRSWKEQTLCFLAHKAIACCGLSEITATAFDAYTQGISRYLKKQFGVKLEERHVIRARALADVFTIANVTDTLYSSPTSPLYGKSFDVLKMQALDPYLVHRSEIVAFAYGLLSHEVDNNGNSHLLQLLVDVCVTPYIQRLGERVVFDAAAGKNDDADDVERIRKEYASVYLMPETLIEQRELPAAAAAAKRVRRDTAVMSKLASEAYADKPRLFFSYYRVPMTLRAAAEAMATESTKTATTVTADTARTFLYSLTKRRVQLGAYAWNALARMPMLDKSRPTEPAVALFYEQDAFFVAIPVTQNKAMLRAAIRATHSQHYATRQTFLSGYVADMERPYLFDTDTLEPNAGAEEHTINMYGMMAPRNLAAVTPAFSDHAGFSLDRDTNDGRVRVKGTYDELAMRERAKKLYLADAGDCDIERYMRDARKPSTQSHRLMAHVLATRTPAGDLRPYNYPRDFITS